MPTEKDLSKLHQDIFLAIDWAASEFKYLEELKEQITQIQAEKDVKREVKEISKAIRIFDYIGQAERRAAIFEDKTERGLEEIYEELSKHLEFNFTEKKELMDAIKQLVKEFNIEHDTLVQYASMYEGLLREELRESQDLAKEEAKLQLLEYLKLEHDQTKANKVHTALIALLDKLRFNVDTAEKWVSSLEASLKRAKEILEKFPVDQDGFLVARVSTVVVSRRLPIRTTDLGGCIVAVIYTKNSREQKITVTHYPAFSTRTKHEQQLVSQLNGKAYSYQKAVLFYKRKGSDVDLLFELLNSYCANGVDLVQYTGSHEQVQANLQTRSWKTTIEEGRL